MQYLRRNPLVIWTKWWLRTHKMIADNKEKHLKLGHLAYAVDTQFGQYNTIYDNVSLNNCILGDYVYIQNGGVLRNVVIGNFCSIGPDVRIGPGMHPVDYISTFPAFYSTRKQCQISFADQDSYIESGQVDIGNDVWIGANAMIMDNIKIGDGAVIAAGAVVTKNVEPYMIVGGVPASPIKKRFSDEEIDKLLKFKWWNKDPQWLKENHKLFQSPQNFFKLI